MHGFCSVPILFKMRFRAGWELNIKYIPLPSHHIVHVASLPIKYSCNSSVGWVCAKFLSAPSCHS